MEVDFTSCGPDFCPAMISLLDREYPEPAEGWVDGVYNSRQAVETALPLQASPEGIHMRGNSFIEESNMLDGDPNTIARETYICGSVLHIDAFSVEYRVSLSLKGTQENQELELLINGIPKVRFALQAESTRAVDFSVEVDCHCIEIAVVPARTGSTSNAWAEASILKLAIQKVSKQPAASPRIFLLGDSIVQTYFESERPQSGWGEWLYRYLLDGRSAAIEHDDTNDVVQSRIFAGEGPTIYNKALGARSFRSYREEHRLEKVLSLVRPGDVALIQFGANDVSKTRPMRYIPPEEYHAWLERYATALTDRGVKPIFVTSTPPYRPHAAESFSSPTDLYADITRKFASQEGIDLIDLRELADEMLSEAPDENRAAYYLRCEPFQYASHPDGIQDPVHLSVYGAQEMARIVAEKLAGIVPWVAFRDDDSNAQPSTVMELRALVEREPVGQMVHLRWRDAGQMVYYSIEKCNAANGRRYARYLSVKPEFIDWPLPGQSRQVRYVVRAWIGGHAGPESFISVAMPADDDEVVNLE